MQPANPSPRNYPHLPSIIDFIDVDPDPCAKVSREELEYLFAGDRTALRDLSKPSKQHSTTESQPQQKRTPNG